MTIIACKQCNKKDNAGNIPNVVYVFLACHKSAMVEVGKRDQFTIHCRAIESPHAFYINYFLGT